MSQAWRNAPGGERDVGKHAVGRRECAADGFMNLKASLYVRMVGMVWPDRATQGRASRDRYRCAVQWLHEQETKWLEMWSRWD